MAQYRRRPGTIEANQFIDRYAQPQIPGVHIQDGGDSYVKTIGGRNVGIALGDWAIQESDGVHYYPCHNDVFHELYKFVKEGI